MAITIVTQSYPPHVLLVRGTASLETVDGVPGDYLEASRKIVPADQFADWEAGVRALYEQMVCITIEPDWAKLLDFETTIPTAVEDLVPGPLTRTGRPQSTAPKAGGSTRRPRSVGSYVDRG